METDELTQVRAFNEQLEQLLAVMPSITTTPPEVARKARAEGRGGFPPPERVREAVDRMVPARDGRDIPVRILVPPGEVKGVYLHIHGGGHTIGTTWENDVALWRVARHCHVATVSVEYRLAPENPFPAGPDDCEDAAVWLVEKAGAEFDTERLLIGGESAGAHLCALTLLRLRDRHGIAGAFQGANLVYGAYDLSGTPSARNWSRNLILSRENLEWFGDNLLPGLDREARRDPEISPLYADLRDMPPALFQVGTLDPLLDDSLFMYERWRVAGNEARLEVYEQGIHGFNAFPLLIAKRANLAQEEFISEMATRA
jgi:acetyl esterase/lipase